MATGDTDHDIVMINKEPTMINVKFLQYTFILKGFEAPRMASLSPPFYLLKVLLLLIIIAIIIVIDVITGKLPFYSSITN